MKKNLFKLVVSSFVLLFALISMSTVFADGGPVGMLQSISDQMISQLKAHQATLKSNPGFVYGLARRLVVPRADLDEMAKRVLPAKTWAEATPQQRAQFKREFTTTLIQTYASALAEYKDQTVKFYPVRGGGNSVTVNSQIIRTDGPSISVNYRLINKGGGWKLVDMTVEGVSMLESFRSQFSDKLSSEDMASLIKDLAAHNSGH